ncbi:MAG: hypothetical protein ABIL62_02130, partial [Planctomycetota bacterium]
ACRSSSSSLKGCRIPYEQRHPAIRAYPNKPSSFVILRRKKACPERSRRAEESGQRRGDSSLRYAPFRPVLEQSEGMTGEPRPCGRGWVRANSYLDRL